MDGIDGIFDEEELRRETIDLNTAALVRLDDSGMRDYHENSDHILAIGAAYNVIVALQSMSEDPRFIEAYRIFHEGVRRIKLNPYLGNPFKQKISKLEKEAGEIALMHFGRVDPENLGKK